jgi:small subunit ribosomal protein S14
MAKTSQVLRDQRRAKLIARYAEKRAELRKQLKDPEISAADKFEIQAEFARLPRNSCPTRLTRRCRLTGRARGVYQKFGLSRIALRELTLSGELPGMRKSSW